MTNLDDAVARLRDAWDNAGRVPAYHHRAKADLHGTWPTLANAITGLLAAADERARTIEGNMTLYSRDAADRLLLATRSAAETVTIDSAHLAELAETIIALHDHAPAPPRIIRTHEELAAADPDTVVTDGLLTDAAGHAALFAQIGMIGLPAVVIATGDHVRAARRALTEATE